MKQLIVVVALALSACGGRADQIAKMTGTASSGETLYTQTCADCHGPDGAGTASGVDLHGPAKNKAAAEIIETIISGKANTAMIPYGNTYSDQQIADLYAYIKSTFGS